MQFAKESQPPNAITRYDAISILSRDETLTGSLVVGADTLLRDWQCDSAETLSAAHIEPLLAQSPEVIILATGEAPRFPPSKIMHAVMRNGVGIEVMNDGAAIRTFNVLLGESRRVLLALIR